MNNEHDIDPVALAGEADAIAAGATGPLPPPDAATADPVAAPNAGEPSAAEIQAIAARSADALVGMVRGIGSALAPNWKITDDESRAIGESAALALAAWFPSGALPYKYWVLVQLGGSIYAVVGSRKDPQTGKLLPLKAPPPSSSDATATTP